MTARKGDFMGNTHTEGSPGVERKVGNGREEEIEDAGSWIFNLKIIKKWTCSVRSKEKLNFPNLL